MDVENRLAALKKALTHSDPITAVRKLCRDDGPEAQQVVVYAFSAIVETGSAGLSILFDRFDDDAELNKVGAALEAIGATRSQADFQTLHQAYCQTLAEEGQDQFDAAAVAAELGESQGIDRRAAEHAEEMERQLEAFCREHLEKIAAG